MFVSLKDKENTVVKQRISQLIEPIKSSRVAASRSERKVLQELFPREEHNGFDHDSANEDNQQHGVAAGSDTKSTRRREYKFGIGSDRKIECSSVVVLERELNQTRAVARLEENSLVRKIQSLNERIELMHQENYSLLAHNKRLSQKAEQYQVEVHDMERRMIDREAELSKEFEDRLELLKASLQSKDIQLMELQTSHSKLRVDSSWQLEDVQKEVAALRQVLAERDCRLLEVQTKSGLMQVELETKLVKQRNEAQDAYEKSQVECCNLRESLKELQLNQTDKTRIRDLEGELEVVLLKYKRTKEYLEGLQGVKSLNQELDRNQKKLVGRCQQLESKIVEKNERVNEIILNYQAEIKGLKEQIERGLDSKQTKSLLESQKARLVLLEGQVRSLTDEKQKGEVRLSIISREVDRVSGELSISHENHQRDLRLKEEKITLLDRQLMERDLEIERLSQLSRHQEAQFRSSRILKEAPTQAPQYLVSYHMRPDHYAHAQPAQTPSHTSEYLQQQSTINQLQIQLESTKLTLRSAEQQLELKHCQTIEMGKVIESQLVSLRQVKRLLDQKELQLTEYQRTITRLEAESKRILANTVKLEHRVKEEEALRVNLMCQYALDDAIARQSTDFAREDSAPYMSSRDSLKSFYERLRERMGEIDRLRLRLQEALENNGFLCNQNKELSGERARLQQRLEEFKQNQRMNEQLIIRIEEQRKAELQQAQVNFEQKYEQLYEKYIRYRRILQKEKERKELQKVIIKDSNQFNDQIVERCKELIR